MANAEARAYLGAWGSSLSGKPLVKGQSPSEAEETCVFNSLVLMHFFIMFVKIKLHHYVLYMFMLQM